jgi:hypothetical protein
MFYRYTTTVGVGLFILGLWASLMLASPTHGRQVRLFEFLSHNIRLSENEMQALKAGEAVTMELPSSPQNELFLFGAVRVDAPLSFYLAKNQNQLLFETDMVQAWGEFRVPPRENDLTELTWPEEDLEDLPSCRPGSCKIKLPAGYLDQLRPFSDDRSVFANRANALLRQALVDYLNSYRRRGNAALMEYRDKGQPVSLADEFGGILENFSRFNRYTPELQAYLRDFPNNRPFNTEDRFIWAKVLLGSQAKRPTIFLYHLVTYRLPGGNDTAIAVKQLYASHYYEAALGLTLIVADPENASRFYLLHFDRGRIDVLRDIPGLLSNGLRGETRKVLARRLEAIKQEAKDRY